MLDQSIGGISERHFPFKTNFNAIWSQRLLPCLPGCLVTSGLAIRAAGACHGSWEILWHRLAWWWHHPILHRSRVTSLPDGTKAVWTNLMFPWENYPWQRNHLQSIQYGHKAVTNKYFDSFENQRLHGQIAIIESESNSRYASEVQPNELLSLSVFQVPNLITFLMTWNHISPVGLCKVVWSSTWVWFNRRNFLEAPHVTHCRCVMSQFYLRQPPTDQPTKTWFAGAARKSQENVWLPSRNFFEHNCFLNPYLS